MPPESVDPSVFDVCLWHEDEIPAAVPPATHPKPIAAPPPPPPPPAVLVAVLFQQGADGSECLAAFHDRTSGQLVLRRTGERLGSWSVSEITREHARLVGEAGTDVTLSLREDLQHE